MAKTISEGALIRGADGRLYVIGANGVSESVDNAFSSSTNSLRAGDRVGFNPADHEAARTFVTPGL